MFVLRHPSRTSGCVSGARREVNDIMKAVFNFLLRALTKFRHGKEFARKDQANPTPGQFGSLNASVVPNATASLLRVNISLNGRSAPDPMYSKGVNKPPSWHPPGSEPTWVPT